MTGVIVSFFWLAIALKGSEQTKKEDKRYAACQFLFKECNNINPVKEAFA